MAKEVLVSRARLEKEKKKVILLHSKGKHLKVERCGNSYQLHSEVVRLCSLQPWSPKL